MEEDESNQKQEPEELDTLTDDDDNEDPKTPWVTDDNAAEFRNIRWRKVIDGLMSRKTITQAYADAYDIDITKTKLQENVASTNGSRLLRNAKFKALWDRVNAEHGFNDQMADSQLLDLMTNPGVEPKDRRAAIADYNKLRGRIIDKFDHTSKGKRIESPAIMSEIKPRDAPEA